ncbi:MAG: efflux RND transporter permease subunit [Fibrobacterales bacterium]
MKSLIEFFAKRHILSNFVLFAVLITGYSLWHFTNKEEMPDFTFNRVSISIPYPGATAEETEYFIVHPIEEVLRGLDGIEEIVSTASTGRALVNVYLQKNIDDMNEVVADIRTSVLDVKLPDEVLENPSVRQFKSSSKAIIDIAFYDEGVHLMTPTDRKRVQALMRALENQLLSLPEIARVNRDTYLEQELQVKVDPERLRKYRIPLNSLNRQIKAYNQRRPAGSMADDDESKVTLSAALTDADAIKPLIVQGGFQGSVVTVEDVATVEQNYEEHIGLLKVNGHEAVILNAVKNSSTGIIKAVDAVKKVVAEFNANLTEGSVKVILLDDESINVRNRLDLISSNGIIGLIIIVGLLFVFLNPQSGFWVAFGIPFCFAFTMIGVYLMGYTINNMTLAAVIIVMGMVVDDAIVIAENIARMKSEGRSNEESAVRGATYVALPVIAAVITTCAAFLPLYYIDDRFGALIKVIPPIITFMLLASLIESLLILPGHLSYKPPRSLLWVLSLGTLKFWERAEAPKKQHWFHRVEEWYGALLYYLLRGKVLVLVLVSVLLILAFQLFKSEFKFVLFPNEETTMIRCSVEAPKDFKRSQTAALTQKIDSILTPYVGHEVVGFRAQIAQSRWGRIVKENKGNFYIEITPAEKREKSAKQLMAEWKKQLGDDSGFRKVRFSTSRFGQSSGSALEIIVAENNNEIRKCIADSIAVALNTHPLLQDAEVDRPIENPEYVIGLKRNTLFRLGIDPNEVGQTLRSILEGSELFDFIEDNEEVRVILKADDRYKKDLSSVLRIPVENRGNYLVPLSEVVTVQKGATQSTIQRENFKRITRVVADIQGDSVTPLEIAREIESSLFSAIKKKFPTATLLFDGEVKDSRESRGTFTVALWAVLGLIYAILSLLFNSMIKPLLIMFSIPFAVVGVIYAFHWHGMNQYGFFAMVGILGLMGVVINDSIVMLTKLTTETKHGVKNSIDRHVAKVAQTRLRAVLLTTFTTVAGLFPTAYGVAGYDAMLAEMMLAMGWGLLFGSLITLVLVPVLYSLGLQIDSFYGRLARRTTLNNGGHHE